MQKEHPEIAHLYRDGNSTYKIVELLGVEFDYGTSDSVAHSAVVYAISGHEGGFRINAYNGLIPDDERERIEHNHKAESGIRAHQDKTGIFGRTSEQQSNDSQRGGEKSYNKDVGVHSQTLEELSELGNRLKEEGTIFRFLSFSPNSELRLTLEFNEVTTKGSDLGGETCKVS